MLRTYLIGGLLVLALFTVAQYRGWSIFSFGEAHSSPSTGRSVYHK
ncbi:MAG: hypothetical protein H6974_09110 [Gammaproteobacteria bacterium]|nr:hypothetical protein [Gammaproteobacteria bacterium]